MQTKRIIILVSVAVAVSAAPPAIPLNTLRGAPCIKDPDCGLYATHGTCVPFATKGSKIGRCACNMTDNGGTPCKGPGGVPVACIRFASPVEQALLSKTFDGVCGACRPLNASVDCNGGEASCVVVPTPPEAIAATATTTKGTTPDPDPRTGSCVAQNRDSIVPKENPQCDGTDNEACPFGGDACVEGVCSCLKTQKCKVGQCINLFQDSAGVNTPAKAWCFGACSDDATTCGKNFTCESGNATHNWDTCVEKAVNPGRGGGASSPTLGFAILVSSVAIVTQL